MARELSVIVKELQSAVDEVIKLNDQRKQVEAELNKVSLAHRNAQEKANALKLELGQVFDGVVPTDSQGRVRVSG